MLERVKIERMSYGSAAIGHLPDGKTVFVEGGVPGDICEVELLENKARFARARVTAVLEPSPQRVVSAFPEALVGCPWAALDYEAQLEAKRANVVNALERTARLSHERAQNLVAACVPSKREWGYRNKLELACGRDAAGRLLLGMTEEGSQTIAPQKLYPLAYRTIEKAPAALQGALRFMEGNDDLGIFRVGVRSSLRTKQTEIALWTTPGAFPRAAVAKTLASALKATSIVRVLADKGRARKVKKVEVLSGKGFWEEELYGNMYITSAPSFFQVNTAQAEKLIELVLEGLNIEEGSYVADLYAGGGTFSLPLAQAGADVVAVEAAGSSVRDLHRNAEAAGVYIEVVGGDSARELPELGELDALVVDPPRAGLAPGVVDSIAAAGPYAVAYVSCDPATWARDVALFEASGYELCQVTPVDMFPQTYHVEVVSIFKQASN
jgi:23S rRNA (uracil1939-C5)-methyltransferase